jgi:serine/threonine protein kinase
MDDSLIGQQLGQYQIIGVLGEGGMATVYRARQQKINREVAIKVIESKLARNADFIKRFEREAQTIATLSHPHILKLFDYGEQGNIIYLVMEILVGGSLADLIRRTGPLPLITIYRILDQIGTALSFAHQKGIIHRDLKPLNVLLDEADNAFLTDFGIAKLLNDSTALTQSGAAMGTPAYMAPEQWQGQPIDSRTDVYALGVMLYEMLSGELPFRGETPASMMFKHLNEHHAPILRARADLPQGIEDVLEKALAKDRDKRFQSADDLVEAFKLEVSDLITPSKAALKIPIDLDRTTPEPIDLGSLTNLPAPDSTYLKPPAARSGLSRTMLALGLLFTIAAIAFIVFLIVPKPDSATPTPTLQTALAQVVTDLPSVTTVPTEVSQTLTVTATLTINPTSTTQPSDTSVPTSPPTATLEPKKTETPIPVVETKVVTPQVIIVTATPEATKTSTPTPQVIIVTATPTDTPVLTLAALAPCGTIIPKNRSIVPECSHRLGEFKVEWYCTDRGYGITLTNSDQDWACINPTTNVIVAVLTVADFDGICQSWYGRGGAFAIKDQHQTTEAYNWSCYEFNDPSLSGLPTTIPQPTQQDAGCPPLKARLVVGQKGHVLPSDPNRLNTFPRRSGNTNPTIDDIPVGSVFSVIDGPVCADNIRWWKVNWKGLVGWTGEGENNKYWLEPIKS